MIPLRDRIPTRHFPIVTVLLIAVNVAAFLYQMTLEGAGGEQALAQFVYTYGVVPARVAAGVSVPVAISFVSSMFLHGSIVHILSNMLYLWIFGNNVEDVLGRVGFLVFYFATGFVASLAQVLMSWGSDVPGIGASGAIAGVLAAYLVFFPRSQINTLIFLGFFVAIRSLPAILVLGLWFVLQLFNGLASFGVAQTGGVAWFAHIGGFVTGLVLAIPWIGRARRKWAGQQSWLPQ